MSDGKRVLATGAGGYIGAVLTPMLLEAGYAVRALDRFFFGRELLADHDRLEVVVEDNRRLTAAHFEGVETVIDLAALSNDPTGELFQEATRQINCAALKAGRIDKTLKTLTLEWRQALTHWHGIVRKVEMHGGILEI